MCVCVCVCVCVCIMWHCHNGLDGGLYNDEKTASKVLPSVFYWPKNVDKIACYLINDITMER